ncbi:helix-turn-helix domain-containing protein [Nisaea sediminum]|uniref:helix-turn-helix domain-containing protein n=1 Tax=Nisaea sediminum TaxID=2775867 RepID=UPI0018678C06|nr:helix-turn-helix domain-containing protein [Nisaea sediminum]
MDSLITAASQALTAGDPLGALKRVALREDAPALALRGIAMAQLEDFPRARDLLRRAAKAFGTGEPVARARCAVAEAEIALVSRDLVRTSGALETARLTLASLGDEMNAAHAGYLLARWHLLTGKLDDAAALVAETDRTALPPASRVGLALVAAGIAMRRVRAADVRDALGQARRTANSAGIPALLAEVGHAEQAFAAPAARIITGGTNRLAGLEEVEALIASDMLLVDTCRDAIRSGRHKVRLAGRPVLFALARALAEAWPDEVTREQLLACAFGAKHADESHRARLRVEIGRLRRKLSAMANLKATKAGFVLETHTHSGVAVLAPPAEERHGTLLALLADGEAWSSSALALALGVSARTTQRALEELSSEGKVESFGRGRACRWVARTIPGFPTCLLLPALSPRG